MQCTLIGLGLLVSSWYLWALPVGIVVGRVCLLMQNPPVGDLPPRAAPRSEAEGSRPASRAAHDIRPSDFRPGPPTGTAVSIY